MPGIGAAEWVNLGSSVKCILFTHSSFHRRETSNSIMFCFVNSVDLMTPNFDTRYYRLDGAVMTSKVF